MAESTQLAERSAVKIKPPKHYLVVMYNDDFTPMDVVVDILIRVFKKGFDEAVTLMLTVHKSGKAVVGRYSRDMAMTKAKRAVDIAREQGYPFRVEAEEER